MKGIEGVCNSQGLAKPLKEYLLDLPLYLLYLSLWESKLPMKEKKYGSEYVNRELGTHIEKQMRILEVLLVKTLPKDKKLLNVIIPLFHSILDSCDSLILLSQRPKGKFPKIRDSFIISRTIIETIINVTFIFAKGEEASKQAEKHWLQRTIRDLDRGIKVGDQIIKLKWTGK
mgnify:FL=1